MAIQQDTVIRKDCAVIITTGAGAKTLAKFQEYSPRFTKNTEPARAGQGGKDSFVEVYKAFTVRVRGLRGGAETLKDLKVLLDRGADVTAFTATDIDDPVPEYGKGQMVSLEGTQPEGPGTFDFEIRFGAATHGYTPV